MPRVPHPAVRGAVHRAAIGRGVQRDDPPHRDAPQRPHARAADADRGRHEAPRHRAPLRGGRAAPRPAPRARPLRRAPEDGQHGPRRPRHLRPLRRPRERRGRRRALQDPRGQGPRAPPPRHAARRDRDRRRAHADAPRTALHRGQLLPRRSALLARAGRFGCRRRVPARAAGQKGDAPRARAGRQGELHPPRRVERRTHPRRVEAAARGAVRRAHPQIRREPADATCASRARRAASSASTSRT